MPDAPRPVLARLTLPSPEETARFAARLSAVVGPGDVLCLEGGLGAGKTHFARALIQHRQRQAEGEAEDVPSPSFTLVQTYGAGGQEIWHADLYRLSDPWEVDELGLAEAFDSALCLVEWPDRMAAEIPDRALWITLDTLPDEDARRLTLSSDRPDLWADRLAGLVAA